MYSLAHYNQTYFAIITTLLLPTSIGCTYFFTHRKIQNYCFPYYSNDLTKHLKHLYFFMSYLDYPRSLQSLLKIQQQKVKFFLLLANHGQFAIEKNQHLQNTLLKFPSILY